MVQVFIVGDDEGAVTVGGPSEVDGRLFAFEWDVIANGGFFAGDARDLDDPVVASWEISADPLYGVATLSPETLPSPTVVWTYELDESNPAVQDLAFGETLTDVFTVTAIGLDGTERFFFPASQDVFITISGICFLAGTKIQTDEGFVAVEDLEEGQYVRTRDAPRIVDRGAMVR